MTSLIRMTRAVRFLSISNSNLIVVLLMLLGAGFFWGSLVDINFEGFESKFFSAFVLLVISGVFGYLGKYSRLENVCCVMGIWLLLGMASIIFCYMFATLRFPLYDKQLSALDKAFGFDWVSYFNFCIRHQFVNKVLRVAYSSLGWQTIFTISFLAYRRKFTKNIELVWITLVSLLITTAVSGIIPACGTFYFYGVGLENAVHLKDYFSLRTGEPLRFALDNIHGIITFPSFHTASAILLTYAHRGERSFYLFLLANILMILATPVFGGHYLVDVLGGGVVAVFSIFLVQYLKALIGENGRRKAYGLRFGWKIHF